MSIKDQNNRVCLGAIVGVHGIKGEVKVKSWTEAEQDVGAYGVLENEDGSKSFTLRVTGHSKELLRCKIKGIDDRNAAEALIGTRFYVSREVLPQLEDEEFYQADLIGLDVIQISDRKKVGKITGIYNFGAGDILEIKPDGSKQTEMIPFTKEYVPDIRIKDGFVTVTSVLMNFAEDSEDHNEG